MAAVRVFGHTHNRLCIFPHKVTHTDIHTCRHGCVIYIQNCSHAHTHTHTCADPLGSTHEHRRHPLVPRGGTRRGSDLCFLWIPEEKPLIPGQVWANISARHAPHTALIKTAEGVTESHFQFGVCFIYRGLYLKERYANFKAEFQVLSGALWPDVTEIPVFHTQSHKHICINVKHRTARISHKRFDSLYWFKWGKKDFLILCGRFIFLFHFWTALQSIIKWEIDCGLQIKKKKK